MTHTQKRTKRYTWDICALSLALMLLITLIVSSNPPVAHGFAADATRRITKLESHGSFHYEMTRVLAKQAGFSTEEAEQIAVACEATDSGNFTGYEMTTTPNKGAVTVAFRNTKRGSKNNLFYHFARRSSQFTPVTEVTGATPNTCDHFVNGNPKNPTKAPCTEKGPELDQIMNWAFNLRGVMPNKSQQPFYELGKPVERGSLTALGIFVHSLGDSYSHEKCMIDVQLRSHPIQPFQCSPQWHIGLDGEFCTSAQGYAFTKTAAFEVWHTLKRFKTGNTNKEPIPQDVNEFITKFIATEDACQRVYYAVYVFNQLTGDRKSVV
jgi:hypothetical protein